MVAMVAMVAMVVVGGWSLIRSKQTNTATANNNSTLNDTILHLHLVSYNSYILLLLSIHFFINTGERGGLL